MMVIMKGGGKTRTTLVLEEAVFKKQKQKSHGNISEIANRILKEALFGRGESMFSELKGLISTKDIVEEEAHEEIYR